MRAKSALEPELPKTKRSRASRRMGRQQTYLGEIGRLPHAIHTTEGDNVRALVALGIHDVPEHVHTALGLQDLHQGLLQCLLYRRSHR